MNVLIVLNYNDFPSLREFIKRVGKYEIMNKIIVVDNASTDGSFENAQILKSEKIEVICSNKNGGYGYGNNFGIKYALKKYPNANLIISNPDVIIEEHTLSELINVLNNSDVSVIAPTILEKDKVVPGRKIITPFKEFIMSLPFIYKLCKNSKSENILFYGKRHYKDKLSYVDTILGCFFVIKGKVMQDIGLYDEKMFLYYEEDVLAIKLKEKGYKTAILNTVTAIHNHSVTINKLYGIYKKEKLKLTSRKYLYKHYQKHVCIGPVIYLTYINILLKKTINIILSFIVKIITHMYRFIKKLFKVFAFSIRYVWYRYHFLIPPKVFFRGLKTLILKFKKSNIYIDNEGDYTKWISHNEKPYTQKVFKYKPLISIIIPHYNTPVKYLKECLDSILDQTYENFEICIADDCSSSQTSLDLLKEYEKKYSKIKILYRKKNGNISAATNSALSIAKGEFMAFMDSDDVLPKDALYWNINALNNDKNIDLIYSDEDKLDFSGKRVSPHFKTDWNPDALLSCNYITHFSVVRKSVVDRIGGCNSKYDGAQDHDMLLKVTEITNKIHHIPRILYHWRMVEGSTSVSDNEKPRAILARKSAVQDALKRRKLSGKLIPAEFGLSLFNIVYDNNNEKVSILLPTHDHIDYLKPCIESIYEKTTYKNFEIILVDHNSVEKESLIYFEECKKKYKNLKLLRIEGPFNYSYLNNEAAKVATGEYLLLLNSDTEIITPEWIEYMLGYARQERIGCVGAKLFYPDNTIQHAGVVLIENHIAAHAFCGYQEKNGIPNYRLEVSSDYSAVTFACAMINKKKFWDVGGLNEELPTAYNDVDFCLKMLRCGYNNVYVPLAKLYHHESKIRGLDVTSKNYPTYIRASEYMKDNWKEELAHDKYSSRYMFESQFSTYKDYEVKDGEE